ncbi:hypothetical protein MLD38_023010 [Melastoma candidum]|uniref:Uncharacterized protein n=1 Tax=Melastoma candidum TaxID=119954 RepID=A0ACB9QQ30_9MYRT|nr:hypothetical protein MLD38_023010 [Melastoma candidum]
MLLLRRKGEEALPVPSQRRIQSGQRTNLVSLPKENISTQPIVATLLATVTFAAGFTVLGGFYGSDSCNKGLAIRFKAFIISNAITMYCPLLAVLFPLWSLSSDGDLGSYFMSYIESAVPLKVAILATMAVAFITGVHPVLAKHDQIENGIQAISSIILMHLICWHPPTHVVWNTIRFY